MLIILHICVTFRYVNFLVPRRKPEPQRAQQDPEVPVVRPKGRSFRVTREAKSEVEATPLTISYDDDDDIAYIDQFTCCPPPFAMLLISVLELAFFLTGVVFTIVHHSLLNTNLGGI